MGLQRNARSLNPRTHDVGLIKAEQAVRIINQHVELFEKILAQDAPDTKARRLKVGEIMHKHSAVGDGMRASFDQAFWMALDPTDTPQLFALWTAIGSVSSDPLVGLRLGVETRTERIHHMGIAALWTENFVAAVKHMARYKKLTAPEEILFELDQEEFRVGLRAVQSYSAWKTSKLLSSPAMLNCSTS